MSLSASEQNAMDAFNLGIRMKQEQHNFDDDVLFFDDPVGNVKRAQEEDIHFDDIADIYQHRQQAYESTTNEPAQEKNVYQIVKQVEFEPSPQSTAPGKVTVAMPQITRESGYYSAVKKKQQLPKKSTKQDMRPSNQSKVMGLINDDEDVGEVGEWVEHAANGKQDDDDEFDVFDDAQPKKKVEPWNQVQSEPSQGVEAQREKINKKLQQQGTQLAKRQGPIVNNLREKAKFMALTNPKQNQAPETTQKTSLEGLHHFSDNEGDSHDEHPEEVAMQESPNHPKIFQLPANSIEKKLSSQRSMKEDEPEPQRNEQDIWEAVNKDRLRDLENKPAQEEIKRIIFIDAWDQLKSNRMLRESVRQQRQQQQPGFFNKLFGCFSVHIKSSKLEDEINQILVLGQTPYDDSSQLHFQIIYTIYCGFVSTDFCQRFGNHWESIGFQGRDPATDLRSTGVFGLLQVLAFMGNYKEYIRDCLEYSKQPTSSIPLCATLINISLFCIQALREKRFHAMINKEDSALSVVNKVYFSAWFFFFEKFKSVSMGGTFDKIGMVLQMVKTQIHTNPARIVQEFNKSIALYYKNREGDDV